MKKILFICTGNTCRSPMAAAIFNHIAGAELSGRDFTAASAGLYAHAGDPPSANAVSALQKLWRIDISEHRARLLCSSEIGETFLILAMTGNQRDYILRIFPEASRKIYTLKEYAYGADLCIDNKDPDNAGGCADMGPPTDIADPYEGSLRDYMICAREIEQAVLKLTERLKKTT